MTAGSPQVSRPRGVDAFSSGGECFVPRIKIAATNVLAKRGVSLAKCTLEALPSGEEKGFHVEHAPIKKPPASDGAFLNQFMDARIDDLYRKGGTHILPAS